MSKLDPPVSSAADMLAHDSAMLALREQVHKLRTALQSIATTLDSATDSSLSAARKLALGMALTALSEVSLPSRPVSNPGRALGAGGHSGHSPKPPDGDTQPGIPPFDESTSPTPPPASMRPVSEGDRNVFIRPSNEPSKRTTEPGVPALPTDVVGEDGKGGRKS
jgi:hypothetical protein